MQDVEMAQIHAQCALCKKQFQFDVPKEAHDRWRAGEKIQDALPMLKDGERELLISNTCEPCFDKLFSETEDEKNTLQGDATESIETED